MSEERVLTKKELESALFSAADALRSRDCKIVCVRMNDSLN